MPAQKLLWLAPLLLPLAWLYGSVLWIRRRLYQWGWLRSFRLPGRVISIGNLEVGGTGKSPIVMAVAEKLLQQGERPAILSRGYRSGLKAHESACLLASTLILEPQESSQFHADEARMQSAKLPKVPVIIGAKRWEAAQRYLAKHPTPTVWILDDGFQHLRIKRDDDWLLLDESTPHSAYHVLPLGRLREFQQTMSKAQLFIFTRAELSSEPTQLQKTLEAAGKTCSRAAFSLGRAYAAESHAPALIPKNKTCGLATGIAKPEILRFDLKKQGWNIEKSLIKADHEPFTDTELKELADHCEVILTTEKDYYRDKEIFTKISKKVFILPLLVHFDRNIF
ncbi:MAG: tetraacyldisaccharide 4'-kinase [Oligoflexus sp.]